jgi:vesicle coat complex subunit
MRKFSRYSALLKTGILLKPLNPQDLTMDVLRVLSATDLEVRRKVLNLALDLVTSRNIEEVLLSPHLLNAILHHC